MQKFIVIMLLIIIPSIAFAKGGGGGGRSGGGSRSSVSSGRSSSSGIKSSPTRSVTRTSKTKSVTSSTSKSAATTTRQSQTAKTVNGKSYGKTGYVVNDSYKPRFSRGYVPPAGSTVYYRESSAMDWLPFYMLWSSMQGNDQSHREAVVVKEDKTEEIVKEEGLDTMYIINWIITIVVLLGIIGGIMWAVYYFTSKK